MSADIARTYDHWSVAVLTVTVHSSSFPTFDFFLNMLLHWIQSVNPHFFVTLYYNGSLYILVDNIYVRCGGQLFRQMVGIPMGTNCAPLLADLFLYSYENEFLDKLIKEGKRKLARRFNLSYRYIDDLISFNNKRFKEFIF